MWENKKDLWRRKIDIINNWNEKFHNGIFCSEFIDVLCNAGWKLKLAMINLNKHDNADDINYLDHKCQFCFI